jgi:hypothetical protein
MAETIYVLVRRNPDMRDHMVEIKGIFKSRDEAREHRQYLADITNQKMQTEIEAYQLLDTVTIGEPNV